MQSACNAANNGVMITIFQRKRRFRTDGPARKRMLGVGENGKAHVWFNTT